jgi:hypothetical protein
MTANRSTKVVDPPRLVLGFGNLSERAIASGIARIASPFWAQLRTYRALTPCALPCDPANPQ